MRDVSQLKVPLVGVVGLAVRGGVLLAPGVAVMAPLAVIVVVGKAVAVAVAVVVAVTLSVATSGRLETGLETTLLPH